MKKARKLVSSVACLVGIAGAVGGPAMAQAPAPIPVPAPQPIYSYAVKYVCGFQKPTVEPGEPAVKAGNYATEVNIYNPQQTLSPIRKRVLVLVEQGKPVGREPEQVKARGFDGIRLQGGNATMDDCNRLWQLIYPNVVPPAPMPLMIGYLILQSSQPLDVRAVYTAATPGEPGIRNSGISIDVETVLPTRVSVLTPVPTPGTPVEEAVQ